MTRSVEVYFDSQSCRPGAGRIMPRKSHAVAAVEQPTTFELAVNLKAGKALGLTIPQSLLLRADEVIR